MWSLSAFKAWCCFWNGYFWEELKINSVFMTNVYHTTEAGKSKWIFFIFCWLIDVDQGGTTPQRGWFGCGWRCSIENFSALCPVWHCRAYLLVRVWGDSQVPNGFFPIRFCMGRKSLWKVPELWAEAAAEVLTGNSEQCFLPDPDFWLASRCLCVASEYFYCLPASRSSSWLGKG